LPENRGCDDGEQRDYDRGGQGPTRISWRVFRCAGRTRRGGDGGRRGEFDDGGNEAVADGGHGLDVTSYSGVVAERFAKLRDDTGESVVGDGDVLPDVAQEFVLADGARAVPDEIEKEPDGLGFEGEDPAGFFDGKGFGVENDIVKPINHSGAMHWIEL
jgi:hypothetical protein